MRQKMFDLIYSFILKPSQNMKIVHFVLNINLLFWNNFRVQFFSIPKGAFIKSAEKRANIRGYLTANLQLTHNAAEIARLGACSTSPNLFIFSTPLSCKVVVLRLGVQASARWCFRIRERSRAIFFGRWEEGKKRIFAPRRLRLVVRFLSARGDLLRKSFPRRYALRRNYFINAHALRLKNWHLRERNIRTSSSSPAPVYFSLPDRKITQTFIERERACRCARIRESF